MTAGDSTGSVSLKMDTSLLIFDDLLKPGKYKFILQIKNCKVTLMKNRLKEYQLTQEFLDQIDADLAKYQVEHYLNGKLLPDCDKIDCYSFPIFVQIPEE